MLNVARRRGVTLLAQSPQRQGILIGQASRRPCPGQGVHPLRLRAKGLSPRELNRTAPLIEAMRGIAGEHQSTVGQVALARLAKLYDGSVIPIAGASRARQAQEAAGALEGASRAPAIASQATRSQEFILGMR